MLDEEKKQQLLTQFGRYLDSMPEDDAETVDSKDTEIDLYRLFSELVALKTEVKIESRQVKAAIQNFQVLTDLLKNNNEQLNHELAACRQQQLAEHEKIEKPFLLTLLDLYDRMEASIEQSENFQPGWFAKRDKNTLSHIDSIHEGTKISLRRLEGLLKSYGVLPLQAIGKKLDPHTMQVSGTEQHTSEVDGIVLKETRKGYLRDGQLLRLAEVIVNKN